MSEDQTKAAGKPANRRETVQSKGADKATSAPAKLAVATPPVTSPADAKPKSSKRRSPQPTAKPPGAARRKPRPPPNPLLELLAAMQEVEVGDFSVRLPLHWDGVPGKLAETFNRIVASNRHMARALLLVEQKVGREGRTRQRIAPANRHGTWAEMERSVNDLIDDLVRPVESMTEAIAGVAKGDLTRTAPLEADGRPLQGEFLRPANIVNRMIEQMGEFSSEVTRVSLELGTADLLGGQAKAKVKGVSGVWTDLEPHAGRTGRPRHRALVADDNRDAADTLAMMLELEGLKVQTLYDPDAFEQAFSTFEPDAVFLDVGMPGRSGYDVAATLRAMPNTGDVLLVAIPGWGQPKDRRRTREAGFDRHMVRPPDLSALQTVCRLLAHDGRGDTP